MALTTGEWTKWRTTIDAYIADRGVWVGLLNEDWEPITTLAPRAGTFNETDTRLAPPEVSFDADGQRDGEPSLIVDELVAEDLGVFDERGRFIAKYGDARSVCVQRAGERQRQAYFLPYTDATTTEVVEDLHLEGAGLLSLLDAWPAPSIPETWRGGFKVNYENAGGRYKVPREYSLFEMSTRVDGYTVAGPAETAIRTVIQDSLDAVNAHMNAKYGWASRPHLVVDWSDTGRTSPEVLIPVQDDYLLPTVSDTACVAGVNVSVDLWWPGDAAVRVRTSKPGTRHVTGSRTWAHPIGVVRVEQIEEV